MIRWLFFVASGILIGGVLHIVSLLAVPVLAPRDAYSRLSVLGSENSPLILETAVADKSLPFQDPAFVFLACRFNLVAGPVDIRVPLAGPYIAMSFHRRDGTAFFSLNDRSALGTVLDAEMRYINDETSKALPLSAGTISVISPEPVGFVLVRAFAPSPSSVRSLRDDLSKAVCAPRP